MRRLFCVIMLMILLGGQACAVDLSLPEELRNTAPEAAKLMGEDPAEGFGLVDGAAEILRRGLTEMRAEVFSGARAIAGLMLGVILLGIVESLSDDDRIRKYATVVGALWITAVSAGDVSTLIGLGQDTIARVSELSKLLMPVLCAATAATGGVTSASVRQVGTVLFSDILLTTIERIMIPALYLYIGTAAASCVMEEGTMERIGGLIKKAVIWGLSGLVAMFTSYLTISGAIAGTVDAQALRLAKTAVSTVVPVVGGILAEAAESVLAGAGLLRGMTGVFGALAVLSLCIAPFLRLGMQYLFYQAAGFVAQAAGPKKLTKLFEMIGDAFALILAMTAACALALIISLVSTLTVVVT